MYFSEWEPAKASNQRHHFGCFFLWTPCAVRLLYTGSWECSSRAGTPCWGVLWIRSDFFLL